MPRPLFSIFAKPDGSFIMAISIEEMCLIIKIAYETNLWNVTNTMMVKKSHSIKNNGHKASMESLGVRRF